jgi:hypothetical protein
MSRYKPHDYFQWQMAPVALDAIRCLVKQRLGRVKW